MTEETGINNSKRTMHNDQSATLKTKLRWFYPTPGKLLVILLAVEGILLLSERFKWFAFNEKKGWTVLIAVAAVGLFLIAMLIWFVFAFLFRWRFQFSIRSLLVLTVAVAIPYSWLAVKMREGRKQLYAVRHIMDVGGATYWENQWETLNGIDRRPKFHGQLWLAKIFGVGFFNNVTTVSYDSDSIVTDNDLKALAGLRGLKRLVIAKPTLTDAALEHVGGQKQLEYLCLNGTQFTDAGIAKLQKALPNCRIYH